MQRKIIKITAFLCLGLFLYFVIRADPRELLAILARLSPTGILALVALRLVFWALRAWSWRIVLDCCTAGRPSFYSLMCAELGGHAVSHFTPSAKLGGDAIRAMMLPQVPKNQALASVVLDKSIELMATVLMMSIGLFVALVRIRMGAAQRALFLSLTVATAALIYVFFRKQKKGLFLWILDSLKRLHLRWRFLEAKRARLAETDAIIADFYTRHRRVFLSSFLIYLAMILLWVVEMHLTFLFLGIRGVSPLKSFLVTTLGIVSNIVPVIPAGLGIYEMTYLSVFAILRIRQKNGIAVIFVRRMLNLLMAAIGLFPMLRLKAGPAPIGVAEPAANEGA